MSRSRTRASLGEGREADTVVVNGEDGVDVLHEAAEREHARQHPPKSEEMRGIRASRVAEETDVVAQAQVAPRDGADAQS